MSERVYFANEPHRTYASIVDVAEEVKSFDRRPATLSVLNVRYVVDEYVGPWWKGACLRPRRQKVVLDDVSMQLKAGQMTAILGNSGSGKTSLLDVITCRSSGAVYGHVYYNNHMRTRDLIKERATYVMQADRLLPNLTVRETLVYTAQLKLPGKTSHKQINKKVSQVILDMGLKDVADSRIGGSIIRGISGGEKRRVTIAIQLLKDPDMIFLDEPTSGLDSYTARQLVSNLQQLARRGKIVLLTIHQPSSDIFPLFDQIGIMSLGHVVYFGPTNQLVSYFTKLGYPCDKYTNPLDRYVDVASIDRRDVNREAKSMLRVEELVQQFKSSNLHEDTRQSILDDTLCSSTCFIQRPTFVAGPSYFRVMTTLLHRMNRNLFRDRKDYVARLFLLPFFMFFILIFLGRLKDTQKSIQDRIGLMYQTATVPPFMGLINSVALFPCLRDLYYRECRDGLYSTTTFLLAYIIHVIPFMVFASIVFSSVVYWVTGMYPDVDRFLIYTLEVFILHLWGEIVTVGCMGLFMNSNLANSVSALMQAATVLIASGFLKDLASLIEPFQWVSWILIHRYTGEILVANEFKDLNFTCTANSSCMPNGNIYLNLYYPDSTEHMARNFGAQGAYLVGVTVLAILAFKLLGLKNLH